MNQGFVNVENLLTLTDLKFITIFCFAEARFFVLEHNVTI